MILYWMKDRRIIFQLYKQERMREIKMLLFLSSYEEMKKLVDERVERLMQ